MWTKSKPSKFMQQPASDVGPKAGVVVDEETLTRAHVLPFAVFMAMLLGLQLVEALIGWDHPQAPWWRRDPAHWVYPLQTVVALLLVWRFRLIYRFDFSWKWVIPAVLCGAGGIALWLLPTSLYDYWGMSGKPTGWLKWLGVESRRDGFDPHVFEHPAAVAATVALRMLRAVVAVALVEEIFWRGFLMRFVDGWDGDCWKQPFGRASWKSYLVVTALFVLAHGASDYAAAVVYGSLTYLLCVWSKSLAACVIMHGTANLLMCIYILVFGKYGLW